MFLQLVLIQRYTANLNMSSNSLDSIGTVSYWYHNTLTEFLQFIRRV